MQLDYFAKMKVIVFSFPIKFFKKLLIKKEGNLERRPLVV